MKTMTIFNVIETVLDKRKNAIIRRILIKITIKITIK